MKTTSSVRKLRTLLRGIRDGTLVPQPEFQRRLVWTNKDKLAFLDTVLAGYPFPEIYIASGPVNLETGEGSELLVDGQQRISTLYQYFSAPDTIKVSGSVLGYLALTEGQKTDFLEYEVVVRDLGLMAHNEIVEIFQKINNTSYSLNAMEVHNARYAGAFKQFAEKIVDDPFFAEHKVFSANEIRRMGDVRFALTLIITIMSTYFHRDQLLEEYLRTYNEAFDIQDAIYREINRTLQFVDACGIRSGSRAWRTSDLLTLLIEVHFSLIKQHHDLNPPVVGLRLNSFFDDVDSRHRLESTRFPISLLDDYGKAAVQATNDRSNRSRRGEIVQQVMSGHFDQELGLA